MEPFLPSFVQVDVPSSGTAQDIARIEVVVEEVVVRVREDIEVGRLAAIVRALAGREPAC